MALPQKNAPKSAPAPTNPNLVQRLKKDGTPKAEKKIKGVNYKPELLFAWCVKNQGKDGVRLQDAIDKGGFDIHPSSIKLAVYDYAATHGQIAPKFEVGRRSASGVITVTETILKLAADGKTKWDKEEMGREWNADRDKGKSMGLKITLGNSYCRAIGATDGTELQVTFGKDGKSLTLSPREDND